MLENGRTFFRPGEFGPIYPGVFAIVSFDEGWNFACTGEFNGANDYATVAATDELYARVYGESRLAQRKKELAEDAAEDAASTATVAAPEGA